MSFALIAFFCGLGAMMAVAGANLLVLALLGALADRIPDKLLRRLVRWFGG